MNKRFFLALVLTAIVIVATPLLFPGAVRRQESQAPTDSSVVVAPARRDSVVSTHGPAAAPSVSPLAPANPAPAGAERSSAETTVVRAAGATYAFTSLGGAPTSVLLDGYTSRRPTAKGENAALLSPRQALTRYRLALDRDTIALDTVVLHPEHGSGAGTPAIVFTGDVAGHAIRIGYGFSSDTADRYLAHVSVSVANAPAGSALLADLPSTLQSNEPDTLDDVNHLAISFRPARAEVNSVAFSKLDSTQARIEPGPLNWVAARNKYFLVVYRAAKTPFSALRLQGAPRVGKVAVYARGTVALPLAADGTAAFDMYTGPQDFQRLQHLGGDLDQVNPYAGWLHPVVQPFATIMMKALLWMKHTTNLNYGWVLVLFGVIIRLVLWPLNQGAMRTSMKMQRLQPELQALQKRHSDDPKKQQEAIMKVYKEHGMSPLSPLMGCLPMLLPMPVLFALYYVFQNTIEFRGVQFLWLPDISLRDPFYITPLLMGASMFVMSWIGMRNAPPNPQAKMMSYMMPVMLTVFFLNFASGLNLYYAVQNIAALPQQWLLARERGRNGPPVISGALEKRRT
jgi:YidC/Oxa1 family membrane protein insertase